MDEKSEKTEEKGLKAKKVSLLAKIVAGGILLVGAFLKWAGVFPNCKISELCTVSGTFVSLFTTIDVNIALDKFRKSAND